MSEIQARKGYMSPYIRPTERGVDRWGSWTSGGGGQVGGGGGGQVGGGGWTGGGRGIPPPPVRIISPPEIMKLSMVNVV